MNIEHKTTPIEHWIVDGKAYRLATEQDVGKLCYRSDYDFQESSIVGNDAARLTAFFPGEYMPYRFGARWRFAYVQDDSLLTPQRTPVPALGDGWYLLRDDEVIEKGDMFDATCADGGWVEANSSVGRTLKTYSYHCRAARYFGPTEDTEIKPGPTEEPSTKPIDWTKPVRTKDGRAVRVLCTDGPDAAYPVIGIIADSDPYTRWTISGKWWDGQDSNLDLENAPQRIQREYWVNVYEKTMSCGHDTKENADLWATTNRIACVKITINCEEGEGL